MDISDNCRICLQEIHHEPIKMTKLVLKFIEKTLNMTNIGKPICPTNVRQNLCAGCFNKLAEFQDFHEVCKDADDFWKSQFEIANESVENLKEELDLNNESELVDIPIGDNYNTSVSTNEEFTTIDEHQLPKEDEQQMQHEDEQQIQHEDEQQIQHEDEQQMQHEDEQLSQADEHIPQEFEDEQQKIMLPTLSPIEDDNEESPEIENFNNAVFTDWRDDETTDGGLQNLEHSDTDARSVCDEIIEYEYQIEQGDVDTEDLQTIDEPVSVESSIDVDYPNEDFNGKNDESSNDVTLVQESLDTLDDQTEVTKNTFFMTTTIDESGKMKMAYKCQHCDKTFSRVYDIESHYNIHNDLKPYTCYVCGKSFRQKNVLTTHQAIHFGKKVECTECHKKFARRSQLILHHRMHRDEKPFVCDVQGCKAAFRQRQHLMDHSFLHTGEKSFQCSNCVKTFHTRKRLQDHIYKVHSQHRYRCDICEKAFLKPHMIKNHMVAAHNVEMNDVAHLKTMIDDIKPASKKTTTKKN